MCVYYQQNEVSRRGIQRGGRADVKVSAKCMVRIYSTRHELLNVSRTRNISAGAAAYFTAVNYKFWLWCLMPYANHFVQECWVYVLYAPILAPIASNDGSGTHYTYTLSWHAIWLCAIESMHWYRDVPHKYVCFCMANELIALNFQLNPVWFVSLLTMDSSTKTFSHTCMVFRSVSCMTCMWIVSWISKIRFSSICKKWHLKMSRGELHYYF